MKIRKSMFETNSSSTHSIEISQSDVVNDKLPVKNGVCSIFGGRFGWEVENYFDARTKASYAALLAYKYGNEDRVMLFENVIKRMTGAVAVEFIEDGGYIDHQSWDRCLEMFDNENSLKRFIFNKSSKLHTDNDNR